MSNEGVPMNKNLYMIPKNYLPLIAGIVWVFAGSMVCKTGFPIFVTMFGPVSILAFIGVFLFFYLMIFRKLVYKQYFTTSSFRMMLCYRIRLFCARFG